MPLLHPSHSPPHPNHYRLSPLAALKRDRPGQSTPRRLARSQIHNQLMADDVSVHCHLFLCLYYFLVDLSSNILAICIDCYHLYRLNYQNCRIKASVCINHGSLAVNTGQRWWRACPLALGIIGGSNSLAAAVFVRHWILNFVIFTLINLPFITFINHVHILHFFPCPIWPFTKNLKFSVVFLYTAALIFPLMSLLKTMLNLYVLFFNK
jgi:hypothetical protein